MKKVYIIHGWGGKPDAGWLAWLNKELKNRGFEVYSPEMPDKDNPKIDVWVNHLKRVIQNCDENTYFVGHSIGCQTILRYIQELPEETQIGGAFFTAGWFNLKNLESDEEKQVATPWLKSPINFKKIKPKIKKVFALFSEDDPYVPVEDSKIFKKELNAKIVIEKGKGHYIEDVTKTIPILLKEIIEVSSG